MTSTSKNARIAGFLYLLLVIVGPVRLIYIPGNPNSQGGEVPSLLHTSEDYTRDEVIAIILRGRAS